jgi:hypothetical protein
MHRTTTAAVVALLCGVAATSADNIDSEHLFGLTEGSDIGTPGERELELELSARAGKRGGAYRVLSQASALKLTLTDSFRVSPIVGFDYHHIRGVPALDNRNQWALGALAFEMKYRVLDRQAAPLRLTVGATPIFARVDEISGERVDGYGVKISAMADRELVADRLLAAVNLSYSPEASRLHASGAWEHESSFTASAAISGRVTERIFLSGELRYERAYEGLALDRFAGYALFIGRLSTHGSRTTPGSACCGTRRLPVAPRAKLAHPI